MTLYKVCKAQSLALGPREVRVQCSSETVDRTGEIVVQKGLTFAESIPVLWMHDPHQPIGRATPKFVNGNLFADVKFADEGISAKADEICGLVKSDVIDTVSIGFDPDVSEPMDPKRPRGPQKFIEAEVLEVSFVSIPANQDAQVIARTHKDKLVQTKEHDDLVAKFKESLIAKGMFGVGRLAFILAELGWEIDDAKWEAAAEGDNSPVPGMLAAAAQALADAFLAMAQEEISEMLSTGEDVDAETDGGVDDGPVMAGKPAAVRKFFSGRKSLAPEIIVKAGATLSPATVKCMKAAQALHAEGVEAHTQGMKSLDALIPGDTGDGDTDNDGDTASMAKPGKSRRAKAGASLSAAAVKCMKATQAFHAQGIEAHTKAMKSLDALIPGSPDDGDADNDGDTASMGGKEFAERQTKLRALRFSRV